MCDAVIAAADAAMNLKAWLDAVLYAFGGTCLFFAGKYWEWLRLCRRYLKAFPQ